jgi:hypothetical protein
LGSLLKKTTKKKKKEATKVLVTAGVAQEKSVPAQRQEVFSISLSLATLHWQQ